MLKYFTTSCWSNQNIWCYLTIKKKKPMGWWGGSAGKWACHHAWALSSILGTYMLEGESGLTNCPLISTHVYKHKHQVNKCHNIFEKLLFCKEKNESPESLSGHPWPPGDWKGDLEWWRGRLSWLQRLSTEYRATVLIFLLFLPLLKFNVLFISTANESKEVTVFERTLTG